MEPLYKVLVVTILFISLKSAVRISGVRRINKENSKKKLNNEQNISY